MPSNKDLNKANRAKKDEFYTQLTDIEKEMVHYRDYFKGKSVFLNCDDPKYSNFWKYFHLNFYLLGLKRLVATHYSENECTYKLEIINREPEAKNGNEQLLLPEVIETPLKGNGDFRSAECIEILKECDIVCTNPPFSLFREYIAQLIQYDKKFIIIGSINAVKYKEVFPLIRDNQL